MFEPGFGAATLPVERGTGTEALGKLTTEEVEVKLDGGVRGAVTPMIAELLTRDILIDVRKSVG